MILLTRLFMISWAKFALFYLHIPIFGLYFRSKFPIFEMLNLAGMLYMYDLFDCYLLVHYLGDLDFCLTRDQLEYPPPTPG